MAYGPEVFDPRSLTTDKDLLPYNEPALLDLFGVLRSHAHKVEAPDLVKVPLNSTKTLALCHGP